MIIGSFGSRVSYNKGVNDLTTGGSTTDQPVFQRLIALNAQFYQTFARPFSDTRQRLQPGVLRLLETLPLAGRFLDLGCGNGELARWLRKAGFGGDYLGLDFSPGLLDVARTVLPDPLSDPGGLTPGTIRFAQADLTSPGWDAALKGTQYDVILSFAVFHHLPGAEVRLKLLQQIFSHLTAGGRFYISVWQFLRSQRLAERVLPWETVGIQAAQLDPNDYLLDWRQGGRGLRYVHHFSAQELEDLAQGSGFVVREQFFSDGKEGDLGLYQVWERPA